MTTNRTFEITLWLLVALVAAAALVHVEGKDEGNDDPLSVLGEAAWTRLRPGWSLTVNDQCLYEFVFQFEHDPNLPVGDAEFLGTCTFGETPEDGPVMAPDGKLYLEARQMWERFPDYVWATIGFNHLSVDWHPCGHQPRGLAIPHYDFSFFRVTPEFRALAMTCKLLGDEEVIVPGEQVCDLQQDNPNGMNFFIVPGAIVDRKPVVNMPYIFDRPALGNGPMPHYGLRSWDQVNLPQFSRDWKDTIPIFMSTYAGDLVMWQAHVAHKMISGEEDQFYSSAERYFETTVQTLPDTWASDYDVSDGVVRFIMVGKAGLCRGDFEKAQAAAGGAPIFPNYDDLFALIDEQQSGNSTDDDESSRALSIFSRGVMIRSALVSLALLFSQY
ncbi:hypothetical protein IV203_029794 [Nitzschia inconspicua]|uniref:Uncharacterized protein n=1 Tax=Nitzschia inconspicua TaxID=303405 RepID=A0A9K3Q3M4_9STRA|nr:hypothetical protein IV203_004875 [Nitzschia inconspicua]KAG7367124.1 hypothetical protein IV203_029794 [Nitzschia inconspicua]